MARYRIGCFGLISHAPPPVKTCWGQSELDFAIVFLKILIITVPNRFCSSVLDNY
ncbi:hypothetical protein HanIR_Chr11g0505511 [Helianthus annuus]|nr:hypothetical protein HanIR_Chr11g0505511 [Helianthus annuus]